MTSLVASSVGASVFLGDLAGLLIYLRKEDISKLFLTICLSFLQMENLYLRPLLDLPFIGLLLINFTSLSPTLHALSKFNPSSLITGSANVAKAVCTLSLLQSLQHPPSQSTCSFFTFGFFLINLDRVVLVPPSIFLMSDELSFRIKILAIQTLATNISFLNCLNCFIVPGKAHS